MVLMKVKIKKYFKEFIGFIVILFIVTNIMSFYRASSLHVNDEICADGSDIVYFWATWCPVCKIESSNIDLLSKYYKVKTIAVKSKESEIAIYKKEHKFGFDVINDKDGILAQKAGVNIYPTIVTCKNKKVYFSDVGYTSTFGLVLRHYLAGF